MKMQIRILFFIPAMSGAFTLLFKRDLRRAASGKPGEMPVADELALEVCERNRNKDHFTYREVH
jgi:hypothetical protein